MCFYYIYMYIKCQGETFISQGCRIEIIDKKKTAASAD